MSKLSKKILIVTNYGHGGVESMLKLVLGNLKKIQVNINLACYAPYSLYPELSVSFKDLLSKKKPSYIIDDYLGCKRYLIGSKFPELEYNHHYNKLWKKIINKHEVFFNISGTIITAYGLYKENKYFFNWVASPLYGDRFIRVKKFSVLRKILDKFIIEKNIYKIEREILNYNKQKLFSLSEYTKNNLSNKIITNNKIDILRYGIDTNIFYPSSKKQKKNEINIGFIGRFDDPRKNINFLKNIHSKLQSVTKLKNNLYLIGSLDKKNKFRKNVKIYPFVTDQNKLREFYNRIDFFIVSSYQEGLCIAALEAMACGCIVLSTRCKGTREYLGDSKVGYYLNSNVDLFINKIEKLNKEKSIYLKMSNDAIDRIKDMYSKNKFNKDFNELVREFI